MCVELGGLQHKGFGEWSVIGGWGRVVVYILSQGGCRRIDHVPMCLGGGVRGEFFPICAWKKKAKV